MDEKRFLKIKCAFEKNGGIIVMSEDVDRHLDFVGADAATLNENIILIRSDRIPSASAIFEELIHTAQYKSGKITGTNWNELEIEAKEKLIKYQIQYKITDLENEITIKQIEELKLLMKEGK